MNEYIKLVGSALLHYVKNPLLLLFAVFMAFTVTAIIFAVHEIKNDT